jgi:hypothetical protein
LERGDRLWDALDQTDAAPTTWTAPAAPEPAASRPSLGGARRTIATARLAAGLLVVGGVAVANAADPSPTPTPSTTQPTDPGTSGQPANPSPGTNQAHPKGNCPNDGSGPGNGTGGSSTPTTPNASPDASGL